ncbi:MAG TPA: 3-keto-5-aminohexanoate cleavage protein [Ktedonobacteraceae bacterium]|nr:3-keto-5-aminohexanoate cleavage protein [Ktedonobacteraceae bacterium]
MLIKACLNGSRQPGEHTGLPLTAAELAREAALVVVAGARALHIHPRSADGKQSLAAQDQAAALSAIRANCPGIPVGVSTAIWIEPDVAVRLRSVQAWTILPDFASVNFDEPGVVELCNVLLERGIGVEAGLSGIAEVESWLNSGLAERCLRILLEPVEEEASAALATTAQMIALLDRAAIQVPRLLHGFEATTWPVLDAAFRYGYDTRVGLEDTLTLPDGSITPGNAELIAQAMSRAASR